MTPQNKENLGRLILAVCDRKAKQENKKTAKGNLRAYTSYRMGKEVHIDTAHAYRIMHGKLLPSRELLMRICKVLGCNHQEITEIFNATDYRMPTEEELEESLAVCAA